MKKVLRVNKVKKMSNIWAKKSIVLDVIKASVVVFSTDNAIGMD